MPGFAYRDQLLNETFRGPCTQSGDQDPRGQDAKLKPTNCNVCLTIATERSGRRMPKDYIVELSSFNNFQYTEAI